MRIQGAVKMGELAERSRQSLLTNIAAAFEAQRCEVSRRGDRLEILMPGVDGIWSTPFGAGVGRIFWDRATVELRGGDAIYSLEYWSWWQLCVHVLVSTVIALQFCLGSAGWSFMEYFGISLLANLVPFLVTALFCHLQCRFALGQVAAQVPRVTPNG